jgi:hypothetical protein
MKPQIIIQEFNAKGVHNGDTRKTRDNLSKLGSWKKQRIVVVIPAGDSIATKVALTHWNLVFPPNNAVARIAAIGLEVGEAYSATIDNIVKHQELGKWEYILTLEHDNMPPADGVIKLLEKMEAHPEFDCIGGLYYTKGEGGQPQIWGDVKDPILNFRPQLPDQNGGLVECCGTGMGFNLWRMKMFKDKKLRKPWFKTEVTNGVMTQDLYAWMDFRELSSDTVW